MRQYIIFAPTTIPHQFHPTLSIGIPTVVWQEKKKKTYFERYNKMQLIYKTLPKYKHDDTENVDTQFRPLPEVVAYDRFFVNPQHGLDLY